MENKTIKDYAKEAKKRLKSGFWEKYKKEMEEEIKRAEDSGENVSKVKEYYVSKANAQQKESDDVFYLKVKEILDKFGEVPDAIGRLTDKKYFETLSYEEKQRYVLTLSEKYLKAIERYKAENGKNT